MEGKRQVTKQQTVAEKQLKQLIKKLSTKPDLQSKCEETLQKDLQNGFVVKVDPATDKETARSYLPHYPVSNENKPGKIRRVTNASSVFQGQSVNSNLLKGPDLLSNLVGVLLRFREQQVAVAADIEQMFMQIKVAPSDRAFLVSSVSLESQWQNRRVSIHTSYLRRNIFPMHSVLRSSSFST